MYIGNNRGTEYSKSHESLEYESAAYWDFTMDGYAEDARANMKAMYEDAGSKKGYYFGYSLGTVQMQIALSKFEEELKGYLNKVIFLAPCTFVTKLAF